MAERFAPTLAWNIAAPIFPQGVLKRRIVIEHIFTTHAVPTVQVVHREKSDVLLVVRMEPQHLAA